MSYEWVLTTFFESRVVGVIDRHNLDVLIWVVVILTDQFLSLNQVLFRASSVHYKATGAWAYTATATAQ